uniref:Uncharacterized protein n=1 Tax=Oryza sativa subsp. japonica TaxID=39947 RepID=Q10MQ9_ORYSJ|nr:hypothetical protein LOC_Os03g18729 [Oryza sativa Japonica Group]
MAGRLTALQSNSAFPNQGTANRRLMLQLSESLSPKFDASMTRDECEDEEPGIVVTSKYVNEATEESTAEKDMPSDGDDAEPTGITIELVWDNGTPFPEP